MGGRKGKPKKADQGGKGTQILGLHSHTAKSIYIRTSQGVQIFETSGNNGNSGRRGVLGDLNTSWRRHKERGFKQV